MDFRDGGFKRFWRDVACGSNIVEGLAKMWGKQGGNLFIVIIAETIRPTALCSGREAIACSTSDTRKGSKSDKIYSGDSDGKCKWTRKLAMSSDVGAGAPPDVVRLYRLA